MITTCRKKKHGTMMDHPLFFDAEVKPEAAKPASKYSPPVALQLAMVAMEQIRAVAAIHPCCLMISSVIFSTLGILGIMS